MSETHDGFVSRISRFFIGDEPKMPDLTHLRDAEGNSKQAERIIQAMNADPTSCSNFMTLQRRCNSLGIESALATIGIIHTGSINAKGKKHSRNCDAKRLL